MNEKERLNNKVVQNNIIAERIRKCPECGSKNIIADYKRAEISCADCGLVIESGIVDLGPEWRAFDLDQQSKRTRTGPPSTYRIHDKGLGTKHNIHKGDILEEKEKRAVFILTEIHRICSILSLNSDFKEDASFLSQKIIKTQFGKYKNRLLIATAIIYLLCKQRDIPITIKEILKASELNTKTRTIRKTSQSIKENFGIKTETSKNKYIQRFCSELKLRAETQTIAMEIADKAEKQGLTNGKSPQGSAAAIIYIACSCANEHRLQKNISEVAGTTEQTLRTEYKKISEKLNI